MIKISRRKAVLLTLSVVIAAGVAIGLLGWSAPSARLPAVPEPEVDRYVVVLVHGLTWDRKHPVGAWGQTGWQRAIGAE